MAVLFDRLEWMEHYIPSEASLLFQSKLAADQPTNQPTNQPTSNNSDLTDSSTTERSIASHPIQKGVTKRPEPSTRHFKFISLTLKDIKQQTRADGWRRYFLKQMHERRYAPSFEYIYSHKIQAKTNQTRQTVILVAHNMCVCYGGRIHRIEFVGMGCPILVCSLP
jgi:hypothetical protein